MNTILKKLSSRKFWATIAGFITGLAMVFGLDENVITSVAGAVVSLASVVTYIITEGKVDAAAASSAATSITEAINKISDTKEANTNGN